jgi:hypothetical protein
MDQNTCEDIAPADRRRGRSRLMAGNGFRRGICPHKLRDVPSRYESVIKRRDQLRKMMMQHYASIIATDETVHDNAKVLLTRIGITSISNKLSPRIYNGELLIPKSRRSMIRSPLRREHSGVENLSILCQISRGYFDGIAGVQIGPGATLFTRMPSSAHARESECVKMVIARCLEE